MKWQAFAGLGVSVAFHIAVGVSLALLVTVNPSDSSRKVPVGLEVVDKKVPLKEMAAQIETVAEAVSARPDDGGARRRKATVAARAADPAHAGNDADKALQAVSPPEPATMEDVRPIQEDSVTPTDGRGDGKVLTAGATTPAGAPDADGGASQAPAVQGDAPAAAGGTGTGGQPGRGTHIGTAGFGGGAGGDGADESTYTAGTAVGSGGGDDVAGRYAMMVRRMLERRGAYPGTARRLGLEGLVRMTVTIDETGAVKETAINSSSGFHELDQAALASARGVSGLPPPPGGRPIMILVPVRFSMRRL